MTKRSTATLCPLDGSPVSEKPEVDRYHVCLKCRELLAPDELVTKATRKTKREYLARNHPNMPRAELARNGYR